VLAIGVVCLIFSVFGHGRLLGSSVPVVAVAAGMLVVLFGMTWGAYRRLGRGGVTRYLITAASVPP